jgi:hypothetical protein
VAHVVAQRVEAEEMVVSPASTRRVRAYSIAGIRLPLMSALLCLVGLGCGPGLVRLGLLLSHVSLGFGLVPLCSAFVSKRIISGESTRRFLGFAFDILDNALGCRLRTGLFAHCSLSLIDGFLFLRFGDDHSTAYCRNYQR